MTEGYTKMPFKELIALGLLVLVTAAAWWRHRSLKRFIRDVETNPDTQYQFHRWATWFWVGNFPIVFFVFLTLPVVWAELALFYTLLVSLYANASTEYGAVSASIAAQKSNDKRRLDELERLARESLTAHTEQRLRLLRLDKRLGEVLTLSRAAEITLYDHDDRLANLQEHHDHER